MTTWRNKNVIKVINIWNSTPLQLSFLPSKGNNGGPRTRPVLSDVSRDIRFNSWESLWQDRKEKLRSGYGTLDNFPAWSYLGTLADDPHWYSHTRYKVRSSHTITVHDELTCQFTTYLDCHARPIINRQWDISYHNFHHYIAHKIGVS